VTVDPLSAPQGATVKLSFHAPNADPTAKMTGLQVAFPTPPATPIATVTVEPIAGWNIKVTTENLAKAITTDDGTVDTIVKEIDWTAKSTADGIGANQFGEFTIDADGLPTNENQVAFKAIQTYSDGSVVRWIDPVTPGGPEAPHPTPILQLTNPSGAPAPTTTVPAATTVVAASTQDNSARALAIIGVALGAVALVFATGGLMKKRRA